MLAKTVELDSLALCMLALSWTRKKNCFFVSLALRLRYDYSIDNMVLMMQKAAIDTGRSRSEETTEVSNNEICNFFMILTG